MDAVHEVREREDGHHGGDVDNDFLVAAVEETPEVADQDSGRGDEEALYGHQNEHGSYCGTSRMGVTGAELVGNPDTGERER